MHQGDLVSVIPGELKVRVQLMLEVQNLLAVISELYKTVDALIDHILGSIKMLKKLSLPFLAQGCNQENYKVIVVTHY